jgi:hypothetical protein
MDWNYLKRVLSGELVMDGASGYGEIVGFHAGLT